MNNGVIKEIGFENEKVREYAVGSKERAELKKTLKEMREQMLDIPIVIGGKEIRTGNTGKCIVPHDNKKVIGIYHKAGKKEAEMAIDAALSAKKKWEKLSWEHRVGIFLRAAELAAGPWRARLNAATMLTQSKTYFQAEIDAACESVDFLKSNASSLYKIYSEQPISTRDSWNRTQYRPLDGFVFAVTPFNFTAIGCNLSAAPAMAGNTVIWKPASNVVYSSYIVYQLFKEAGLPDGVINFLPGSGSEIGNVVLKDPNLAGIHFTGSTDTFQEMWKAVGDNIQNYRSFPKLVGETGGKNYVLAHASADVDTLVAALIRGAYELQGQKCSATSRCYIPKGLWPEVKEKMIREISTIKVGDVEDFSNFIGAVIDQASFDKIKSYIDYAKNSHDAEILAGGKCDDSKGYFIEPTFILTNNPDFRTLKEEIFGPVLTAYVYEDERFDYAVDLCESTTKYGLTGSIFAKDRYVIAEVEDKLMHTAGNFYINDKTAGASVGLQPFGGARASGTNDKVGSIFNMMRWISPRVIKDNFNQVNDYRYSDNIE
ncbi:L-glutamate gamma-semialdehyde dehydrogenase [Lutispora saccharofermentans]|uniref:L-glutamate gamma-semialdehyde dehydrogenase n=1 Tax=Lutispora saccharofermentans TaxID=3024236 RepID=A0ABT1NDA2_9FIRM|nr:L-glutamate gamma-semialdehyde dehydrogenase [Lutispora saccharofermentans]MCQ1529245.1 L-glutamate gamma-semialdehyde dehydrogenase [Lutispora saccharofermentans]